MSQSLLLQELSIFSLRPARLYKQPAIPFPDYRSIRLVYVSRSEYVVGTCADKA